MFQEATIWPRDYDHAVMVTLNVDAEYFIKMYYDDMEPDASPYEEEGLTSIKQGLNRVLNVLESFGIRATVFVPGRVVQKYPEYIKSIVKRGHEMGVHGYKHENLGLLSEEEQEEAIRKGIKAIEDVCGVTPIGFRAPEGELTNRTLKIAKECGIRYSSTLANDDRPYYNLIEENGETLLEIPIHWALFDLPYFIFRFWPPMPFGQGRISNFKKVLTNWKWEYDVFKKEGLCYVLQLDPLTMGDPGRIYMLEELLTYIKSGDSHPWFATGTEMYEFYESKK